MSRTRKGSKSPGQEYWSRRPFNKGGGACSTSPHVGNTEGKRRTLKAERRAAKLGCRQAIEGGCE